MPKGPSSTDKMLEGQLRQDERQMDKQAINTGSSHMTPHQSAPKSRDSLHLRRFLLSKRRGVRKSMGHKVPWKTWRLICHLVTSRPLISCRKKEFYLPVTSRPPILTAFILHLYLPSTSRPMKWRTLSQRPTLSFHSLVSCFTKENPQIYQGFSLTAEPTNPWKRQRKYQNNQGNSLLKINQGNRKNQGKEGQGIYRSPAESLIFMASRCDFRGPI